MGTDVDPDSIYFVFVYTVDPKSQRMTRQVIGIFEDVLSAKRMERLYNARVKKQVTGPGGGAGDVRDESGRIIKAVAIRYAFPYVAPELLDASSG